MSKKYVQGAHVRLTDENLKLLQKAMTGITFPPSINTLANACITLGVKLIEQKSPDGFRHATKATGK